MNMFYPEKIQISNVHSENTNSKEILDTTQAILADNKETSYYSSNNTSMEPKRQNKRVTP